MDDRTAAHLDAEIRACLARLDIDGATTQVIQTLGPELLGFVAVVVRDPTDAGDVFADLCMRIWKGIGNFRWDSSLRTWCYVLARCACYAFLKTRARRGEQVPLSEVSGLDRLIARITTTTLAHLERQPMSRVDRLRAKLTPEEQALLTLRIDRELDWREIARILADEALDEAGLVRDAAALRKRFERVKAKLRALADAEPP